MFDLFVLLQSQIEEDNPKDGRNRLHVGRSWYKGGNQ